MRNLNFNFWICIFSIPVITGVMIALKDPFIGFFLVLLAIPLLLFTLVAGIIDFLWNTKIARYFLIVFVGVLIVLASTVTTTMIKESNHRYIANNIVGQLEWWKITRGKYPTSLQSFPEAQKVPGVRYESYENGLQFRLEFNSWHYRYYDSQIGEWQSY